MLVPQELIESRILILRGRKVMIDADLALLYQVKTMVLNQTVKRNTKRFPNDFMFRLNQAEKEHVITNCDHLKHLKFSPHKPYVFTEQGVAMLSSVLNSERAIHVNIQIMRAFVNLRRMIAGNRELKAQLEVMEKKYDNKFRIIFDAIRQLLENDKERKTRQIGFKEKKK